MNNEDLPELALKLVRTQRTMVLATADPQPWSAPVYFVCVQQKFYFFSSVKSRHAVAVAGAGNAAASIFRDGVDWRDIEGLQMEGCVERIGPGREALHAFSWYVRKHPTVKDFFLDTPFDFTRFVERFRTQLFAFTPERIFYLNNRAGLGKRQEIQLPT